MRRDLVLCHVFVEFIPRTLEENTIYISLEYATAAHKCCCGCGREVVTPLSPTDWTLMFNGTAVSLDPSVGNWSFPCQSHYWIRWNRVHWARRWSQAQIEAGRAFDAREKERYYSNEDGSTDIDIEDGVKKRQVSSAEGIWMRLKRWIFGMK